MHFGCSEPSGPMVGGLGLFVETETLSCPARYTEGGRQVDLSLWALQREGERGWAHGWRLGGGEAGSGPECLGQAQMPPRPRR